MKSENKFFTEKGKKTNRKFSIMKVKVLIGLFLIFGFSFQVFAQDIFQTIENRDIEHLKTILEKDERSTSTTAELAMRKVNEKELKKIIQKGKAHQSVLKKAEKAKPSETKVLAASMVGVANSINENTRVVMSLVEYMKLEKEGKPVVVEMPKQKETPPWEHITFEVTSRDSSNLLKSFDAKRIK